MRVRNFLKINSSVSIASNIFVKIEEISFDSFGYCRNLTGHTDAVSCLAFTKDSHYLASGCLGGNVRVWCVMPCITICLLLQENVHDLGLNSMDFCVADSEYTIVKETCSFVSELVFDGLYV